MIDNIVKMIILWTIGNIAGIFFRLLVIFGRIELVGYDWRKFIPPKVMYHNHPSLLEVLIMPLLLWPVYLFWPSYAPYSTPEVKNYFQKKNRWWSFLIRPFCIPVDRDNALRGTREIIRRVNNGKSVVTAPEGGRTVKGNEFKVITKDGKILIKNKNELALDDVFRIRRFQKGFYKFSKLIKKAPFLPIGIDGTDKMLPNELWYRDGEYIFPSGPYFLKANLKAKIRIVVGEHIEPQKITDISVLEDELLKLMLKLSQNRKPVH